MSIENLKKFGELCTQDETVLDRVKEIGINNPEGLMAYAAKEFALDFNKYDMIELAKETGISEDELSEDELEKIAGGMGTVTAVAMVGLVAVALFGGALVVGAAVGFLAAAGAVTSAVAGDGS